MRLLYPKVVNVQQSGAPSFGDRSHCYSFSRGCSNENATVPEKTSGFLPITDGNGLLFWKDSPAGRPTQLRNFKAAAVDSKNLRTGQASPRTRKLAGDVLFRKCEVDLYRTQLWAWRVSKRLL